MSGRGGVMGPVSLGERAARQTRPGREWGGWGRAGHLTHPFFYLRHRHAELRVGPGPSRLIQARPGSPSLPGTHTRPCREEPREREGMRRREGLGGAEKERENGGDNKGSPGVRGSEGWTRQGGQRRPRATPLLQEADVPLAVCVCVGGGLITTPQASPNEAQKRPREAPAPPLCPAQAADPLPPAPCFPLSR